MSDDPDTDSGTDSDVVVVGGEPAGTAGGAAMRARTWAVAANFRDPEDYGIPPLPEWTVYREDGGGLALGAPEGDGVFLATEAPVTVRR